MALRVHRFVCAQDSCPRKTFAEQVPGPTRRFGRRTERLRSTLASVGQGFGGADDPGVLVDAACVLALGGEHAGLPGGSEVVDEDGGE
ncbi:hypothetical protein OG936_32820 [Streptomyces sp. NBC_00846]|uniref:hypothetical protein n=1 Tax=Streptomyces sp. NBC_00846 TaxID=2975849 RepID=UPI00386B5256|nr:hypothetical protein OG936_32820 [Streptomyces sp. NBC_00846]